MGGMSAAGWSVGAALVFVGVWTVMMAAMMLPGGRTDDIDLCVGPSSTRSSGRCSNLDLIAGYLFVWSAVGVLVYGLVQVGADASSYLGLMDRAIWGPLVLGAALVGAGIYQFTPLKRVCLRRCRSPMAFVAMHWHDGPLGAVRMGIWHGAYCLGCCWALFAILVVAGIMSLAWMMVLTLVVLAEKVFAAWPTRFGNYRRRPARLGGDRGWFDLLKMARTTRPEGRRQTSSGTAAQVVAITMSQYSVLTD